VYVNPADFKALTEQVTNPEASMFSEDSILISAAYTETYIFTAR
jgi:hypothetical protein